MSKTELPPYMHWMILAFGLLVLAGCVVLDFLGIVDDAGAAFEACRVWFAKLLGVEP